MINLKPNTVAEESAVETPTQTSSPQVEAQTTEGQTPPQGAPEGGASDEPKFQSEEERRAFQEMRLENKRLKEEIEGKKTRESAFASFRPQQVPNVGLANGVKVEDYTDPYTGEINRPAYNAGVAAEGARVAAVQAQQSVQDQLDEDRARNKYPDLFADAEVEEEIAARWLKSKMSGEAASVLDIAGRVAKRYQKAVTKAEKSGADQALSQLSEKEQAALAASGQTSSASRQQMSADDYASLQLKTRLGDQDSITSRISRIPWVNK